MRERRCDRSCIASFVTARTRRRTIFGSDPDVPRRFLKRKIIEHDDCNARGRQRAPPPPARASGKGSGGGGGGRGGQGGVILIR